MSAPTSTTSTTSVMSIAAFTLGSIAAAHCMTHRKSKVVAKPVTAGSIDDEINNVLRLPCINLDLFFKKDVDRATYLAECAKVAEAFHKYGVCVVKDPRVAEIDNERFLNMVERYFEGSDGIRDARPDFGYQVGVTPAHTGNYH